MPADYSGWKCTAIQTLLNENCATRAAEKTVTGYLDALLSPINTQNALFSYEQDPDGRKRDIEVQFTRRPLVSEFTSTDQLCPGPTTNEIVVDNFTVTPDLASYHAFNLDGYEMQQLCTGRNALLLKHITDTFTTMRRDINQKILALLVATGGTNGYGSYTPGTLDFFSSNEINFDAFAEMKDAMEDLGCLIAPFVISDSQDIKHLARALSVACCNDAGIDFDQLSGDIRYFNDKDLDAATAVADSVAVINPGSMLFVPYLTNVGENEIIDGQSERTTITDPMTGLEYNLTIYYDVKCHKWEIQLSLDYTVAFIPDDLYKAGDDLEGTRGWLLYTATP